MHLEIYRNLQKTPGKMVCQITCLSEWEEDLSVHQATSGFYFFISGCTGQSTSHRGDKVHVPSSVSCSFLALRNQSVESREPKKEVISVTEALPRKGGRAGTRTGWYQC